MSYTQLPHLLKKIALTAIASIAISVAVSGGVFAAQSGGIGGEPAIPRADNPRSESIFIHDIEPGASQNDAVKLINNTDEDKILRVYPVDSVVSSGGAFACEQRVDERNDVGSWIGFASEQVEVPAQSTKEVPFTITVPETASVGEQNGCIAIEEVDAVADTESVQGVALSFRSAIRVAVTVPGDLVYDLKIKSLAVEQDNEQIRATPVFVNNGNVSLDSAVNVQVQSWYGRTIEKSNSTFPILPNFGESSFNIDFEQPYWGGFYNIVANATYQADGEDASTADKSELIFVKPATGALVAEIVVLLLLLAAAYWYWKKHHHKKEVRSSWVEYNVEDDETIESIATKHNVKWQKLAEVNKVAAPYTLQKNQILKVPPVENSPDKNDETEVDQSDED